MILFSELYLLQIKKKNLSIFTREVESVITSSHYSVKSLMCSPNDTYFALFSCDICIGKCYVYPKSERILT